MKFKMKVTPLTTMLYVYCRRALQTLAVSKSHDTWAVYIILSDRIGNRKEKKVLTQNEFLSK